MIKDFVLISSLRLIYVHYHKFSSVFIKLYCIAFSSGRCFEAVFVAMGTNLVPINNENNFVVLHVP